MQSPPPGSTDFIFHSLYVLTRNPNKQLQKAARFLTVLAYSINKCVADTVRALIGCRTTFYNEAARGDIYFTQSVVRARVSEAPVDLLGRERRATA